MKVLLDVNVLLDILDDQRANATESIRMFDELGKEYTMYLPIDALSTIAYILKSSGNDVVGVIEKLLENINAIDTTQEDTLRALDILDQGIMSDFEDAQILAGAIRSGCRAIITNDKQFLKTEINAIEIVKPVQMLERLGYTYDKDLFGGRWVAPGEVSMDLDEVKDANLHFAKLSKEELKKMSPDELKKMILEQIENSVSLPTQDFTPSDEK